MYQVILQVMGLKTRVLTNVELRPEQSNCENGKTFALLMAKNVAHPIGIMIKRVDDNQTAYDATLTSSGEIMVDKNGRPVEVKVEGVWA